MKTRKKFRERQQRSRGIDQGQDSKREPKPPAAVSPIDSGAKPVENQRDGNQSEVQMGLDRIGQWASLRAVVVQISDGPIHQKGCHDLLQIGDRDKAIAGIVMSSDTRSLA